MQSGEINNPVVACVTSVGANGAIELHHKQGVAVVNAPPSIGFSVQLDDTFSHGTGADVILAASKLYISEAVISGHHPVIVLLGEDCDGKYDLAEQNGTAGMLGSIAEQLFARDGPVAAEEADAVRLSWFTIASEAVCDVLAAVGGQHPQGLQVTPNLHGAGSAAGVKGLWEVAVTSAGDVAQLLAGVRAKSEPRRDAGKHSVYVFNVYKDGAVLSTVSVVLLGAASAPDESPGAADDGIMAWVRALQRMLQAGEQHGRRAIRGELATSSGATTLLAPLLTGAVPGLLLAAVRDEAAEAPASVATLKFASRLRRIMAPTGNAAPPPQAAVGSSASGEDWESRGAVPQRPALPAAQRHGARGDGDDTHLAAAATLPMVTPTQGSTHVGGSAGGAPHGEAPWGSVRPSTLPSLDEASAMAERMSQRAAGGDAEARWFMAMLSALEASREQLQRAEGEAAELRGAWEGAVARADAAEERATAAATAASAASGEQEDAAADKGTVRALRAALKEARAEVRDYELYRDVMEATMGKLKGEVAKLVAERDEATKAANKAKAARRKDKGAVAAARAEVRDLQAQVDALASELGTERQHTAALRTQLKRQSEASHAALQAAHEGYSSPRQGAAPQAHAYSGSRSGSTRVAHASLHDDGEQHVGDEELLSAVHSVADDVLRVAGAGKASTTGGRAQLVSGLADDMQGAEGGHRRGR